MEKLCFVIMPFGGRFDELYQTTYAPAIQDLGLTPLRADEIYDNQPIIQDIDQSIRAATLILADVTGRNPNVNYELGAAHALKKEVVITTSDPADVPSDYRHIRYLIYNMERPGWDRYLAKEIQKTMRNILQRLDSDSDTERQPLPWAAAVTSPDADQDADRNSDRPETDHAVCLRDDFYVADIAAVFENKSAGHCFYKLAGLLPLKALNVPTYALGESHWLADWNQAKPRFSKGETVKFKIYKIYPPENHGHVQNARNISCAELSRA
jgi:hypothetical protein